VAVDTEEAVVIEEAVVAGNAVGRQEGLPGSRPSSSSWRISRR
jgi:hypothetical protein